MNPMILYHTIHSKDRGKRFVYALAHTFAPRLSPSSYLAGSIYDERTTNWSFDDSRASLPLLALQL